MATPADGAGTGLNLGPLLVKQFRRISPSLSAAVLALALGSCGTKYLERATPAVINSGLEELISEENQERLRELAAIPDLRAAARELTQGVLEASLEEFDSPERAEKIFALTETFIDRAMAALEEAVGTELGPRFRRELALSVEEVLAAVSESASLDDLAAAGRSLVSSATRALTETLAEGIDRDLTPALLRALERLSAAAAALTSDEEFSEALATNSRSFMRGAMLGLNDALEGELGATLKRFEESSWQRFESRLKRSKETGRVWLGVFGSAAVVLALALGFACYQWRLKTRLAASREGAVDLLASAIHGAGRRASVDQLLTEIKQRGRDKHVGYASLSEFLARHQELRIDREGE